MTRGQRGLSLVTAIFLLVVLATLATFMVSLSTTQHYTTAYAQQGARAYHAAQTGLQWGISAALAGHACPAPTTFTPGGALSHFSVAVNCAASSHTEHGATYNVYVIVAVATSTNPAFGQPGYASRQLTSTVTDAPLPGP